MEKTIDELIEEIKLFEDSGGHYPWSCEKLGDEYRKLGREEEATKYYTKAMKEFETYKWYGLAAECAKKLGLEELLEPLYKKQIKDYEEHCHYEYAVDFADKVGYTKIAKKLYDKYLAPKIKAEDIEKYKELAIKCCFSATDETRKSIAGTFVEVAFKAAERYKKYGKK
jgi:tetratricopeptide (TPR) repeat protein